MDTENSSLYYYNVDNKNFDLFPRETITFWWCVTYKNELGNNWIIQSGVSFCYDNTNLGYNYNTLKNRIGSAEIKQRFLNLLVNQEPEFWLQYLH